MTRRNNDGGAPRSDLMALRGARFVTASEGEQDTFRIGDGIVGKRLYGMSGAWFLRHYVVVIQTCSDFRCKMWLRPKLVIVNDSYLSGFLRN
jgi:hypothetical protein